MPSSELIRWLNGLSTDVYGPASAVEATIAARARSELAVIDPVRLESFTDSAWYRAQGTGVERELGLVPPPVVAASLRALLSAANHVAKRPVTLVDLLSPSSTDDLASVWDLLQNEAEVRYEETAEAPLSRVIIDATWDPVWRVALLSWAARNSALLSGPAHDEAARLAAANLDVRGYLRALSSGATDTPGVLPCGRDLVRRAPGVAAQVMRLWRATSVYSPVYLSGVHELENSHGILGSEPERAANEVGTGGSAGAVHRSSVMHSQRKGDLLEASVFDVFNGFFNVDSEERERLRSELRRQSAGTQFGTDIIFRARAADTSSTCLIECKNYAGAITVEIVAAKVLQAQSHYAASPVDHFILVSPHADPNNELDKLVQEWNAQGQFPFDVQIWSPQTGVRDLFALVPEVYFKLYGSESPPDHSASATRKEFSRRLRPPIRLPKRLGAYIQSPGRLLQGQEKAWEPLLNDSIARHGLDANGQPVDQPLTDVVIDSLTASQSGIPTVMLWADFGEGKSFFTVQVCEVLRRRFISQPGATQPVPLRMLLKAYRTASSAEEFVEGQMLRAGLTIEDFHALVNDWSLVVVLDGMDEMSTGQDVATIRENLRRLSELLDYLEGVPVLLTSRPQFLASSRDRELLYDRLRRPSIFTLAQPSRRETVNHLRQYATARGLSDKLDRIKSLYDPVGLAGKVLFLDMIKESLEDLPEDRFDEEILYRTYVDRALRRKIQLLRDKDALLTDEDMLDRLERLLERIAVAIHLEPAGAVDLHGFLGQEGGAAELLWNASSTESDVERDSDASSRFGSRSLLRRVTDDGQAASTSHVWMVDFFHRSMKEYFVARHILWSLDQADGLERTRRLLAVVAIEPAIASFFRLLMRGESTRVDRLVTMLRSARRGSAHGRLGAGAATLLAATGNRFAGGDWRGLDLEGALLGRQDFTDADLRGASLRGADLTSADFTRAKLQGTDLTDANLDLGDDIVAVVPVDRSAHFLCLTSASSVFDVRTVDARIDVREIALDAEVDRPHAIGYLSEDLLVVVGRGRAAVYEQRGHAAELIARFLIDNDITFLRFLVNQELSLIRETQEHVTASVIDLESGEVSWSASVQGWQGVVTATADSVLSFGAGELQIRWPGGSVAINIEEDICVVGAMDGSPTLRIATGTKDGKVITATMEEGHATLGEIVAAHTGRVTALGVGAEGILSSGADGSLALVGLGMNEPAGLLAQQGRRLQCRGSVVDAGTSRNEREQLLANGAHFDGDGFDDQSASIPHY